MKEETILHIGGTVICDWSCGADWTERPESGGFLFQSKAVCPDCAPKALVSIKKYNEFHFIQEFCPPELSFKDWVIKLRGGDNTISIRNYIE